MARIARRALRLRDVPVFSLREPWHELAPGGKLPLNLFEPRYVELARRVQVCGQFGYVATGQVRRQGRGMLIDAEGLNWTRPDGPVRLVAAGVRRFRVLRLRADVVEPGAAPLYMASLQLLADRDLARLPVGRRQRAVGSTVPSTVFGQVYVQRGGCGFASYHFDEAGPYISYESQLSKAFPALDDGSAPPLRKPFEGASYNPGTRTFRGAVTWNPTWQGAERWEYEMVFSSDLLAIVGGTVRWRMKDGQEARHRFGVDLHYTLQRMHLGDDGGEADVAVREALLRSGVAPSDVEASLGAAASAAHSAAAPRSTAPGAAPARAAMRQRRRVRLARALLADGTQRPGARMGAVAALARLAAPALCLTEAEEALHEILLSDGAPDGPVGGAEARAAEVGLSACWQSSGDPEVDAVFGRGVALLKQQRFEEAVGEFTKVVRLAPCFAEGWNKRATAYNRLTRFIEAIEDLWRVLSLKPRHFGAMAELAMCHLGRGEYRGAVACMKRVLEVHPRMRGVREVLQETEAYISQRSAQDLAAEHLRLSEANRRGETLPAHSRVACSWDVHRVREEPKAGGGGDDWVYLFRVRLCNPPESSGPALSLARFCVFRAADGEVRSLGKPTQGEDAVYILPGEEHRFYWVLLAGQELLGASSRVLLEHLARRPEDQRLMAEELSPLKLLDAPEVGSSDVECLCVGYGFLGRFHLSRA